MKKNCNERRSIFFEEDGMNYPNKVENQHFTLISALDKVLERARRSTLNDNFWRTNNQPIEFLSEQLEMTKMQVVFLAILIEFGEPMSWKKFGDFLKCSRLSVMVYSDEMEDLVKKRWVIHRIAREGFASCEGFALVPGVVTALRKNEVFVPEKIDGLSEQEFVKKLERHLEKNIRDINYEFKYDEEWMVALCQANPDLPLCNEILSFKNIHDQSLLLLVVFNYAQFADSKDEGLDFKTINSLYHADFECEMVKFDLRDGSHFLIQNGFIENKCEEGVVDSESFVLTRKTKENLLSNYTPFKAKSKNSQKANRYIKKSTDIQEKELFFNQSEQGQIDRLSSLLSQENLPSIQERLKEQGMRKGFACLFYGGPGTGKTETVLQIARKTGRNIMQIDIAGLRDKWVGESEKNIKAVFEQYRDICKNSDVMPILFFNEADGIISKRTEDISHSVDKMNNSMQNIILQEMEDLDGILIATTNLTCNLDSAFERRFLFKIKFDKPNTDVKAKIWSSMLNDICESEAKRLASKFDFSGGQIENVARKRTVDHILNGRLAGIEEIEKYCMSEILDDNKKCRSIVGFRA